MFFLFVFYSLLFLFRFFVSLIIRLKQLSHVNRSGLLCLQQGILLNSRSQKSGLWFIKQLLLVFILGILFAGFEHRIKVLDPASKGYLRLILDYLWLFGHFLVLELYPIEVFSEREEGLPVEEEHSILALS